MTFTVEISDKADADIQTAFLWLAKRNPDFAGRWVEGLIREIEGLSVFPTIHSFTPESEALGRPARRMLYRNGKSVYRVLFCLLDLDEDDTMDTVRVLHVRHGAQRPPGEEESDS